MIYLDTTKGDYHEPQRNIECVQYQQRKYVRCKVKAHSISFAALQNQGILQIGEGYF